jgi:hypothetical protein
MNDHAPSARNSRSARRTEGWHCASSSGFAEGAFFPVRSGIALLLSVKEER